MARFLHTADLHLGKILYNERLLDDQAAMLASVLSLIDSQRPDALLIAGDVFDRSVPPSEAVELMDNFLHAVCNERAVPIVMIPGNHDSADRVGFGARLLDDTVHIVSTLERTDTPFVVEDEHGPVHVFGLPFLEPARVRAWLDDDTIRDHNSATHAMVARIRSSVPAERSVLLAHAFVTGGLTSDSERPLTIGGLETVDASAFDGIDYVALGHLHRAQSVGRTGIQYSGSPLKYSASEVNYKKSITQIDMDGSGHCEIERLPLKPLRDLVIMEGRFESIIAGEHEAKESDLIIARITDKGPVYNAMTRLRMRWPNALHIERTHRETGTLAPLTGVDHREKPVRELFHAFFEAISGESLSTDESAELDTVLTELRSGGLEL